MLEFMTNQVSFVRVAVYQEDGSGGFDSGSTNYPCYNHPATVGETFEDMFYRVSNDQLNRVIATRRYSPNQRFTLGYNLKGQSGLVQFTARVSFTPISNSSGVQAPQGTYELWQKWVAYTYESIWWPRILDAYMVALDKTTHQIVFSGKLEADLFQILEIHRQYCTNSYDGVIVVALINGTSAVYALNDGHLIARFELGSIRPVIGLSRTTNGFSLLITGGSPFQTWSLPQMTSVNPGAPTSNISVTFDNIGSAVIPLNTIGNAGFYQPPRLP